MEEADAPTLGKRIHELGDRIESLHENFSLQDRGVVKVRPVGGPRKKLRGASLSSSKTLPEEMLLYFVDPKDEQMP